MQADSGGRKLVVEGLTTAGRVVGAGLRSRVDELQSPTALSLRHARTAADAALARLRDRVQAQAGSEWERWANTAADDSGSAVAASTDGEAGEEKQNEKGRARAAALRALGKWGAADGAAELRLYARLTDRLQAAVGALGEGGERPC